MYAPYKISIYIAAYSVSQILPLFSLYGFVIYYEWINVDQ